MHRGDWEFGSGDISHFRLALQLAHVSALAPFKLCKGCRGVRLRISWCGAAVAAGAAAAAVGVMAAMLVLHPRYFPSLPAHGAITDAIVAYSQPLQALVTVVAFAVRARKNTEVALGNARALDSMLGLNTANQISKIRRFLWIETGVIVVFMLILWTTTIYNFGELNTLPIFICNAYLVGVNTSAIVQLTNTALYLWSRAYHLNKILIHISGVGSKDDLEKHILQCTYPARVKTQESIHCKCGCDEGNLHSNSDDSKLGGRKEIILKQNKKNIYKVNHDSEDVITKEGLCSKNYLSTPTSNQFSTNSLSWNTQHIIVSSITPLEVLRNQQRYTRTSELTAANIDSSNMNIFNVETNNSLRNNYSGKNFPLGQNTFENVSCFTAEDIKQSPGEGFNCPCQLQRLCHTRVIAAARMARTAHCLLGNLCDAANDLYGLPVLLESLKTLVCLVYWLVLIFRNMFGSMPGNVSNMVPHDTSSAGNEGRGFGVIMACFFLWVVFHLLKMALMTWACGAAATEAAWMVTLAQKLKVLLSLSSTSLSPTVQHQLDDKCGVVAEGEAALTELALHVVQRPTRFMAAGGIPLDQSLLLSLSAAIATYLLVLMQICDNTLTPARA